VVLSYADVVGTAGLLLAVVTSSWQIRTARLQRPQLNVAVEETVVHEHDDAAEPVDGTEIDAYWTIRVVNFGGQPVDLLDAGVVHRLQRGRRYLPADRESWSIVGGGLVAKGPKLPRRIDAASHLQWVVRGASLAGRLHGGEVFAAFAKTVGRPTLLATDGVIDVRSPWTAFRCPGPKPDRPRPGL